MVPNMFWVKKVFDIEILRFANLSSVKKDISTKASDTFILWTFS